MEKVPEFDMYEFIDDGFIGDSVNRSFYTILGKYIPEVKHDFSTANLINTIPMLKKYIGKSNNSQDENQDNKDGESTPGTEYATDIYPYIDRYKTEVAALIKVLYSKVEGTELFESTEAEQLSEEDTNRILEELKDATKDDSACKDFKTIEEFLEYATKTMNDPKTKSLRDSIVKNAIQYDDSEHIYSTRLFLLKTIYVPQAKEKFRGASYVDKNEGKVPDWKEIDYIRRVISRPEGLREYDEYYQFANTRIRAAVQKAIAKERMAVICEQKRFVQANDNIAESLPVGKYETAKSVPAATLLFDKLKRSPEKTENSWSLESFSKPEVICDMFANYSENGVENQRVIAIRYGKFKYQKPSDSNLFNLDEVSDMPELVGISRIGKDGTKNYFVLMPPLSRLVFRKKDDPTIEPDEQPYGFTIREKFEVPGSRGKTTYAYHESSADIVDTDGVRYNTFLSKGIPENLKDFYAKVYFSDEYLKQAISHNARYVGTVADTDDGPRIRPSDIGKTDLAAAHYAVKYPGFVDGRKVKSLEKYCSSGELDIRQYTMIQELERQAPKKTKNDRSVR